ncbi:hypothetical protein JCM19239_1244 [Vibrio variabilis]|uniref:Uncharacterized protein n=1 Tax=Vibrio variabilis TaxID=990271 RepID=A0ABQ0JAW2_9VIBR|nr:hypothetical protein JCM19239_1244 [Vibrio variabilis]
MLLIKLLKNIASICWTQICIDLFNKSSVDNSMVITVLK